LTEVALRNFLIDAERKLSAMAITSMTGNDFARALDGCIERSNRAKVIEGRAIEVRNGNDQ
jgi:hypothetical protein